MTHDNLTKNDVKVVVPLKHLSNFWRHLNTPMMKNHNEMVKINHNLNWPYIFDHPYQILITGGSGSDKTILNLIKHQRPDIDKFYLYVKDPFESKYQLFINGREKVGIEIPKNPKTFIDYSQTIQDIYENLKDYPTRKSRVLIVFDDMIADMESNKKLSPIVTELFLKGRKLNISFLFI